MEQTMIKVTINGETREYPKMTPYSEIARNILRTVMSGIYDRQTICHNVSMAV